MLRQPVIGLQPAPGCVQTPITNQQARQFKARDKLAQLDVHNETWERTMEGFVQIEDWKRTSPSRRPVTTPPGRIRATYSRVRPTSGSSKNIGYEHLTSPSRRPTSPLASIADDRRQPSPTINQHTIGPYGLNLAALPEKLAAQLLVVEAESKNANVSVSALIASDEMQANKNKAEHTEDTSKQLLEEDEVSYVERLELALPLANATPQRERENKEREWLMIVANLILLVKEGAKLLENVDEIMGGESAQKLVESIQIVQGRSPLADLLYRQLEKVASYHDAEDSKSDSNLSIRMQSDIIYQLQMLTAEGQLLLAQLDSSNTESIFETLSEGAKKNHVSRLFFDLLFSDTPQDQVPGDSGNVLGSVTDRVVARTVSVITNDSPVRFHVPLARLPSAEGRLALESFMSESSEFREKLENEEAAQALRRMCSTSEGAPLAALLVAIAQVSEESKQSADIVESNTGAVARPRTQTSVVGETLDAHSSLQQETNEKSQSKDMSLRSLATYSRIRPTPGSFRDIGYEHIAFSTQVPGHLTSQSRWPRSSEYPKFSVELSMHESEMSPISFGQCSMLSTSALATSSCYSDSEQRAPRDRGSLRPQAKRTRQKFPGHANEGMIPRANQLDSLIENVNELSIARSVPRVAVHERRLKAGLSFAKQQAALQLDVIKASERLEDLLREDNDESRMWTHAWKIRAKDISANTAFPSEVKKRAVRDAAKARNAFIKLEDTDAYPDQSSSAEFQQPACQSLCSAASVLPTDHMRRPATGVRRPQDSEIAKIVEMRRPKSSPGLRMQRSVSETPNGAVGTQSHATAMPRGISHLALPLSSARRKNIQYVHPTAYKLMNYNPSPQQENVKLSEYVCKAEVLLHCAKAFSADAMTDSMVELRQEKALLSHASEEHLAAVRTVQRVARGMIARKKTRPMRIGTLFLQALYAIKALKQSELNVAFEKVVNRNFVGEYLEHECAVILKAVDEVLKQQRYEQKLAEKHAAMELEKLKDAEAQAHRQLEEADDAESRMDKERLEMVAWKVKVDRAWRSYEDTKKELYIEHDQDEEQLLPPQLLREKKNYEFIFRRYLEEKAEYEESLAKLQKERMESQEALQQVAIDRLEWQRSQDQVMKERAEVEALVLSRKFTDSRVSVRERMRCLTGVPSEAKQFITLTRIGKHRVETPVGMVVADSSNFFAGEFRIVQEVSIEDMQAAFKKNAVDLKYLDLPGLKRAMREVGRKINDDEGSRLVRSFDVDGNGHIEFNEFKSGLDNMVGMELPHGYGQEIFADGSQYVGEFYEDKRNGIGMFTAPSHHFYIGQWSVGVRHGKGFEGRYTSNKRVRMLPSAVVTYVNGIREKINQFATKNAGHLSMFRAMLALTSMAQKRATNARQLVSRDVHRNNMRKHNQAKMLTKLQQCASQVEQTPTAGWSLPELPYGKN